MDKQHQQSTHQCPVRLMIPMSWVESNHRARPMSMSSVERGAYEYESCKKPRNHAELMSSTRIMSRTDCNTRHTRPRVSSQTELSHVWVGGRARGRAGPGSWAPAGGAVPPALWAVVCCGWMEHASCLHGPWTLLLACTLDGRSQTPPALPFW